VNEPGEIREPDPLQISYFIKVAIFNNMLNILNYLIEDQRFYKNI